jgi:hypothetical protein
MVCEPGIQWDNLILASKSASGAGPGSSDHCALLMNEMIITSGIVYSVSQQKVYGLIGVIGWTQHKDGYLSRFLQNGQSGGDE